MDESLQLEFTVEEWLWLESGLDLIMDSYKFLPSNSAAKLTVLKESLHGEINFAMGIVMSNKLERENTNG